MAVYARWCVNRVRWACPGTTERGGDSASAAPLRNQSATAPQDACGATGESAARRRLAHARLCRKRSACACPTRAPSPPSLASSLHRYYQLCMARAATAAWHWLDTFGACPAMLCAPSSETIHGQCTAVAGSPASAGGASPADTPRGTGPRPRLRPAPHRARSAARRPQSRACQSRSLPRRAAAARRRQARMPAQRPGCPRRAPLARSHSACCTRSGQPARQACTSAQARAQARRRTRAPPSARQAASDRGGHPLAAPRKAPAPRRWPLLGHRPRPACHALTAGAGPRPQAALRPAARRAPARRRPGPARSQVPRSPPPLRGPLHRRLRRRRRPARTPHAARTGAASRRGSRSAARRRARRRPAARARARPPGPRHRRPARAAGAAAAARPASGGGTAVAACWVTVRALVIAARQLATGEPLVCKVVEGHRAAEDGLSSAQCVTDAQQLRPHQLGAIVRVGEHHDEAGRGGGRAARLPPRVRARSAGAGRTPLAGRAPPPPARALAHAAGAGARRRPRASASAGA